MRFPHLLQRRTQPREALYQRATREAEAGRRLVMYDRETGFYAPWFLQMRFDEEVRRSERYESPLTLLSVEVQADDVSYRLTDSLRTWLNASIRSTDLVSHLGGGRYIALLTDTNMDDAASIAARLASSFPGEVAIGLAAYPEDGESFENLHAVAERRAHDRWSLAI